MNRTRSEPITSSTVQSLAGPLEHGDMVLELLDPEQRHTIRLELVDGFVKGRVSIIMPAFNEADCICTSISEVKKRFSTVFTDCEIIVVDDGSCDGTRRLVKNLPFDGVKLVS